MSSAGVATIDELAEQFILTYDSTETRTAYRRAIMLWRERCGRQGAAPLRANAECANIKAQWQEIPARVLVTRIREVFHREYTAHDLRHRYAIDLHKAGGHDACAVLRTLGHNNIVITTTYLQGLGAYAGTAA